MPLYEYICHSCGHEFDEIQKFSDNPITKCPKCSKNKIVKKVSLTAFHLKGEGWYKDGYSRPSDKPKPKEPKNDKSSKGSSPKSKVEGQKGPIKVHR